MVKYLISIFFLIYSSAIAFAQPGHGRQYPMFKGGVVVSLPWNTDNGLVQKQSVEGSFGSTSFTSLGEGRIAFLNEIENEVTVFNNNQIVLKFKASISPTLGLSFVDNKYFIYGINECSIHDSNGVFIEKIKLPIEIKSVRNVVEINGDVFFVTNQQISYLYKNNEFVANEGVVISKDIFFKTNKLPNNNFEVKKIKEGEVIDIYDFETKNNLSSLRIIGGTRNTLYLDAEFIVQEKPLVVERRIYAMDITNNGLVDIDNLVLPNSYFVAVRSDLQVVDGSIYYFTTTPESGSVYKMQLSLSVSNGVFNQEVLSSTYHYNNNYEGDVTISYGKSLKRDSVVAPISRREIIARAEAFFTHVWTATEANIWDKYCDTDNQQVISAPQVKVGENTSVPYMWDGFSSLEKFDEGMANGLAAGNINTKPNIGSMNCAEGVDCSGYVSQAWNTVWKYDTREFYPIVIEYNSWNDLKPGDIANKPGHVRLFHSWNDDGSMKMLEATSRANLWSVVYKDYTISEMQSRYTPCYLYSVYEETASLKDNEVFNNAIKISPNPVVDLFKITSELDKFNSELTFVIINTKGEILKKDNVDDYPINIEGLNTGIYFVRISSKEFTVVKKIIKK